MRRTASLRKMTCLMMTELEIGVAHDAPIEGAIADGKHTRQVFSALVGTEKLYTVRE